MPESIGSGKDSAPLKVGSWTFGITPEGWESLLPYGLWRSDATLALTSNVTAIEDKLGDAASLEHYVQRGIDLLRQQVDDLVATPMGERAISGLERALGLMLVFSEPEGGTIVQHQVFGLSGDTVGILTLTTTPSEQDCDLQALSEIVSGCTFELRVDVEGDAHP